MTTEQLNELAEALTVLMSKSSVLKERNELRALMEENLQAEEVTLAIGILGLMLITFFLIGPQVTFGCPHEAYSFYAYQDRQATGGL